MGYRPKHELPLLLNEGVNAEGAKSENPSSKILMSVVQPSNLDQSICDLREDRYRSYQDKLQKLSKQLRFN